ncbi:MAG: hypothetical protein MJ200_02620 [Mycoplasmoidaceae bacterium]|nr:hypothetical protein [Mycoplasmoidaceae bacterium]
MKLKKKILIPIVGVTALSASVAPALVGCNNKAEVEIKQFDVHVEQTSA